MGSRSDVRHAAPEEPRSRAVGESAYVHALRFRWLNAFYDALMAVTLPEDAFKARLVAQAGLAAGQRVLDLGCGTATLTILLKQACRDAKVVGLDGDPRILEIARGKVSRAGVDVTLVHGRAEDPPFEPASFDRIVSSLVFHHLTGEQKRASFAALRTRLRPRGELHVADWGAPHDLVMRAAFLSVQLLDGFATTSDNVKGRLIPMMREAGFIDVQETYRERTPFGTLSLHRARVAG
jgi:cyclopropane fatty-acyl-phospholipid synthase-like methyltransferase